MLAVHSPAPSSSRNSIFLPANRRLRFVNSFFLTPAILVIYARLAAVHAHYLLSHHSQYLTSSSEMTVCPSLSHCHHQYPFEPPLSVYRRISWKIRGLQMLKGLQDPQLCLVIFRSATRCHDCGNRFEDFLGMNRKFIDSNIAHVHPFCGSGILRAFGPSNQY